MSPDKRAVTRIQPFVVRCHLECGDRRVVAYITDLSPRGAQLACDEPLPDGVRRVGIEVRFGGGAVTHLHAEAKWSRARAQGKGFRVGVRFLDLSQEARQRIETAVEEFRAHAAQLA